MKSALARLIADPRRFRFDAALRILTRHAREPDPAEAVRFGAPSTLAYPAPEVQRAEAGERPRLTVSVVGLTGAAGVLPRLYSEVTTATLRNRSRALADFLDLLAHRFVAGFGRAGIKYRLSRAADQALLARARGRNEAARDDVSDALLALTGYGTPGLLPRLAAGAEPLLHYSGLFAMRPRSAERLAALLSDWLGRPVEVEQFAGAWLRLPPDQQTAMPVGKRPGAYCRLGVDAAIGTRAWDQQGRIMLRIGPLDLASFEELLPDRPLMRRLVSLARAFVGHEIGFAINPVLSGPEVPPLRMSADADPPPRLGWNCWMTAEGGFRLVRPDAADAVFDAEVIEAQPAR